MKQQILEARDEYARASLRAIYACLMKGEVTMAIKLNEEALRKLDGESARLVNQIKE